MKTTSPGEADDGDARFKALESWMRALVPELGNEAARWSGQVLETIDYCGFIGRNPGSENVFVATGDSGQGMTHGALAGILLKDLIVNGSSPWQAVYEPVPQDAGRHLQLCQRERDGDQELRRICDARRSRLGRRARPGQGGIIRDGMSKVAACRDLEGRLHVHSAACTHLGLPRSLELNRTMLGLSVPRLAICAER